MAQLPDNISFEEWVRYVFDHPVTEPQWYFELGSEWWDVYARPNATVAYLTELFENAANILKPYTDAELNQGFWFLTYPIGSDHMFLLLDEDVPWSARKHCIQSIYTLFERLFAVRCSPHLSDLDEPGTSPLNSVCYMWWDLVPIYAKPDEPNSPLDEECLAVMEKTLRLPSVACQQSALHGLGHWSPKYFDRVENIVDQYFNTFAKIGAKK